MTEPDSVDYGVEDRVSLLKSGSGDFFRLHKRRYNVVGGQRENMPGIVCKVLRSGKAGKAHRLPNVTNFIFATLKPLPQTISI